MKNILIIIISALIFSSCSDDSYNGGVGGNTDYPLFDVKSNVKYPYNYIFENDTLKFEYPDFFNVEELITKGLIRIEGLGLSKENIDLTPKVKMWINPDNKNELLILGLEPNTNNSGWYSINEHSIYIIYFFYSSIGKQYTDWTYNFNIRDSRVD